MKARANGSSVRGSRRALALVLVGGLVVTGCSGRGRRSSSAVRAPLGAAILPPPTTAAPPVEATLPVPIDIPDDPYAPEPVTEIGAIEIPKLGLHHRIFEGVTLNNIDRGPSHWPGSAMPGQPGNAVFAGHRVSHDHPFRHLDQLVPGDLVIFTVGTARATYRVTGTSVVGPTDTRIAIQTLEATATLYTCHPPGSLAERFVVHLELVPSDGAGTHAAA